MTKTFLLKITRHLYDLFQRWYCLTIRNCKTFTFNRIKYSYCSSKYNYSWVNERSVEIPIFQRIINNSKNKRILEVGNVISNYQAINHTVVDKYEKSDKVINQDILNFKYKKKFDLIISISTIEHIGWDEDKKDSTKIIKSLQNLKSMLKDKGEIWFSVPVGYNSYLDNMIYKNKLPISQMYFLKRISGFTNNWMQIKQINNKNYYGKPYPHANLIMIGKYLKK